MSNMKTIVYFPGLHGDRSENSKKISFLKEYLEIDSSRVFDGIPSNLPEDGNVLLVMESKIVEDFEKHLTENLIPHLKKIFRSDGKCIFVGTSLGGMYSVCLANMFDAPCVVTNPCLSPSSSLKDSVNLEDADLPNLDNFCLSSEALLSEVKYNHPDCIFVATCKNDEVVREKIHVLPVLGDFLNVHASFAWGGHGFESYDRIKWMLGAAFDLSCDEGPLI